MILGLAVKMTKILFIYISSNLNIFFQIRQSNSAAEQELLSHVVLTYSCVEKQNWIQVIVERPIVGTQSDWLLLCHWSNVGNLDTKYNGYLIKIKIKIKSKYLSVLW